MSAAALLSTAVLFIVTTSVASFPQQPSLLALQTQIASGVHVLKAADLDTAERLFTDALHHGAKSALVFHNLGVIAQERGNHPQAVTYFRRALVLEPNYGPSRLLLGSSLLMVGKDTDALRELRRTVSLIPHQPAARLELVKAYEASGNWVEVVRQLQKLVNLAPDNAEYSYQLAKALTKLFAWSLQKIGRLNPNSARLLQAWGRSMESRKNTISHWRLINRPRVRPETPGNSFGHGPDLAPVKRFDDALDQVRLELSLVPHSKTAAETKARIEAAKASGTP